LGFRSHRSDDSHRFTIRNGSPKRLKRFKREEGIGAFVGFWDNIDPWTKEPDVKLNETAVMCPACPAQKISTIPGAFAQHTDCKN
jgi:hypothetical protein